MDTEKIKQFIDNNTYQGLADTLKRLVRVAVTTENIYFDTASSRDYLLSYEDELLAFFIDLYHTPGEIAQEP